MSSLRARSQDHGRHGLLRFLKKIQCSLVSSRTKRERRTKRRARFSSCARPPFSAISQQTPRPTESLERSARAGSSTYRVCAHPRPRACADTAGVCAKRSGSGRRRGQSDGRHERLARAQESNRRKRRETIRFVFDAAAARSDAPDQQLSLHFDASAWRAPGPA